MTRTRLKALVVEDDGDVVECIRRTMIVLDHDCVCVTNVQDAREALRKEEFHYVLLDLKIPAMPDGLFPTIDSGMTFLAEVGRERGNGHTPVFVMTSHTNQGFGMAVKLTQMGASLCIPKPLDDKPLSQIIQEVLDDHGRRLLPDGKLGQPASQERQSKPPKTVDLRAPSRECYAELAVQSDKAGILRVLFANPGPGRPTEVGSIPIRDQPLKILVAGIEAAIKRIHEAAEELPTDRLPEECRIILEWSADSLRGHVRGEANARRQAMSRLRSLVRFQDGVGLVSDQDGESGTWRSTIPFRFQTSGQL